MQEADPNGKELYPTTRSETIKQKHGHIAHNYLDSEGLNVVGTVGTAGEVGQVELNLVPAVVESHGHGANEGLDSRRALVVAGPEPPPYILVIQHLNAETRYHESKFIL